MRFIVFILIRRIDTNTETEGCDLYLLSSLPNTL